ncbi:hypothetical protein LLS47_12305 [Rouxiella badensis]|uniref:hypothetical protein n=1 Tax=Rouxiella badensis TaxID=1646377 RepID=UPI001D14E422|nr:hypothetical protein [Rouxiella badensis]MCC3733710.1 hypothetical protein [Rouxiella badensis]MCC3759637.1 hypothetical protein [Rouxiella badensis]
MRKVEIIPATEHHAAAMLPHIRQADIDEFYAAALIEPDEVLRRSMAASTVTWAGLVDGEVVAIFGVCPASLLTGFGVPWLVGSDKLESVQVTFLRHCRPALSAIQQLYPRLENFVDARNTAAKSWLHWLGFTLQDAQPYGALQLPFHHFALRADHV